jgi:ubiquinol oxidase
MVAYFEKEAVNSYTEYLRMVEAGEVDNVDCPKIAIRYYGLPEDAKLADLIIKVREDERKHSKLNHLISL